MDDPREKYNALMLKRYEHLKNYLDKRIYRSAKKGHSDFYFEIDGFPDVVVNQVINYYRNEWSMEASAEQSKKYTGPDCKLIHVFFYADPFQKLIAYKDQAAKEAEDEVNIIAPPINYAD